MRAFLSLLAGALVMAFWVYTLVDCIRSDESQARGLPKGVWVFVIIILPVVGSLLWLTIGKAREGGAAPARPAANRPLYPDDDIAFLRRVDSEHEREERIRKLEEKLAELDDDDNKNDSKG